MQVLTQTITISREKSIATEKKFIVWKISFKVLKPSIKSSIQTTYILIKNVNYSELRGQWDHSRTSNTGWIINFLSKLKLLQVLSPRQYIIYLH